jgi:hypothetical protein
MSSNKVINTDNLLTAEQHVKHTNAYLLISESLLKQTQINAALNDCRKGVESICKQIYLKKPDGSGKPVSKYPLDQLITYLQGLVNKGDNILPKTKRLL